MRRPAIPVLILIALAVACGNPQRPDAAGYTPLMHAARDGDVETIRRLIERGHDVNYKGREVVRYGLLFPFRDVETVDIPSRSWTPLIAAAAANRPESIRELIRLGADIKRMGVDGPPIIVAAERGALEATRALIDGGADPSTRDRRGTPLTLSLRGGHYALVRLLLERGASAGYEYDLEDALLVPLAHGDYAIIREIFTKTRLRSRRTVGREGLQMILSAVGAGHDEAARIPIDAAQDLSGVVGTAREMEIVTATGRDDAATVLRLTGDLLRGDHFPAVLLGMAAGAGSRNVVEALMRAGAPADARDRENRTPLMIAREARTLAAVEALIAAGADVNLTGNRLGRTPLMHAASAGNVPLMKLLIARGARVDGRDRKRWSAIRIAHEEARSPAAVEVLTAAGASASDLRDAELVAAYLSGDRRKVEELLRSGADASTSTARGASLLSDAIRNRNDSIALLLIRSRADPDFGGTGTNPLIIASQMGREEIVMALLAGGANPNITSAIDEQPLTVASRHPRVVRMLIRAGADVNQRANGETPLGRVIRVGHTESARMLRSAGATENGRRLHLLSEAAARGDVAAFERELASAGTVEKERALVAAAMAGQTELARRLLNRGVSSDARTEDWTAVQAALAVHDAEMRQLLLERGATAMPTDPAALGRDLIDAARRGDVAAVTMLLDAGSDVNWRGSHNYAKPALFVAVEHDRAEAVRLLIARGADVNRGEKFFYTRVTPLMTAALEGSENAARVLIAAGADIHYVDERGTTALSIAEGQRDVNYLRREPAFTRIAAMLRKAGAKK
jgi:ankyrin repeat protein